MSVLLLVQFLLLIGCCFHLSTMHVAEMLSGLLEELTGTGIKLDLNACVELKRVLYHVSLEMVAGNTHLSSRETDNDLIT